MPRSASRAPPPDSPAAVAAEVERTIRSVAPSLKRVTKYGAPTYQGQGDVVTIGVWTKFVAVGFWRGDELQKAHPLLEGEGKSTRLVRLRSVAEARSVPFRALLRAATRLDRAPSARPTRR